MKKNTLLIGGLAVAAIVGIYMYNKRKAITLPALPTQTPASNTTTSTPSSPVIPTPPIYAGGYDGSGINPNGMYTKPVTPPTIYQPPVVSTPVAPVIKPKRVLQTDRPVAGLSGYVLT